MMLGYDKFIDELKEKVQEAVEAAGKVIFTTITKNNGAVKEGLSIETEEANKVPVIGLKDIYGMYQEGSSMEECVEFCRKAMDERENINILELWGTWEEQKQQIRPCLVNREWNQERLKELPHFNYGDLAVKFRVEYRISDEMKAGYDVTYEMLVHWGVTKNQLTETAMQNLRDTKYTIRDLQDVIGERLDIPTEEEEKDKLYLLRNEDGIYGASGMLRTDLLESFAEEKGCDFYILPSSVHELLLVVDDGEITREGLEGMVREVNRICVAEEEKLSDQVYYFKKEIGKAELAA